MVCNVQRKARFSDSACSRQRQQAHIVAAQQGNNLGCNILPPDK